jgi:tRNA (uracil-5-)-methyltransferase TRM9
MDEKTVHFLIDLNRRFYDEFGQAFASTRRRIQPGVRRILAAVQDGQDWLDLGCGSGALAQEWSKTVPHGSYTGLDFSPTLLAEARSGLKETILPPDLTVQFFPADLSDPHWADILPRETSPVLYDGALAFAVFHHLPSRALRRRVLQKVCTLMKPGARFIHSEWQFQNSARLMERRLDWSTVGLDPSRLEEGDTLLDWRHALPGQPASSGLRYVHLFSRAELAELAAECGFKIMDEFESDGAGNRLGLYQVWGME